MTLSSDAMIKIAATVTGLTCDDLRGKRKCRAHVRARMIAVLLYREFHGINYSAIGRLLRKERTIGRHAIRDLDGLRATDAKFAQCCVLALRIAQSWQGELTAAQTAAVSALQPREAAPRRPRKQNRRPLPRLKPIKKSERYDSIWHEDADLRASLRASEARLLAVASQYCEGEFFRERAGGR